MVFEALECSTAKGRQQLSRIVGRDTAQLEPQQIRKAALETLAENLSDGVIAPLFWFALLGAPGMLTYKMINTLDSMIGYKNERYLHFGKFAARLDDVANYLPARLTVLIMLLVKGKISDISFILKFGKCHSSPNSGYPEAALASILNCRFGGPNSYFGKIVDKTFIGTNEREISSDDMKIAINTNLRSEFFMLALVSIFLLLTTL
jgi:cobalamin biosynthesis protein CobD